MRTPVRTVYIAHFAIEFFVPSYIIAGTLPKGVTLKRLLMITSGNWEEEEQAERNFVGIKGSIENKKE